MGIYTRTGDKGTTTRYDGSRVPKDDDSIKIVGKFDSLMASLDYAHITSNEDVKEILDLICKKLWQTAGEISLGKPGKKVKDSIGEEDIKFLEEKINELDPNINYFINFRTEAGSRLNESRIRCRELESSLTSLYRERAIREEIYAYINRLSDLLYVLACKES